MSSNKADQCTRSLENLKELISATEKRNEDLYQKDIANWKAQKTNMDNAFQGNWNQWAAVCGETRDCEPVTQFFYEVPGKALHGCDVESFRSDYHTCLRRCRSRTNCDFAMHDGNTCWIKNFHNCGWNSGDHKVTIKTPSGTRVFNSGKNERQFWDKGNIPLSSCQSFCQNNSFGQCDFSLWRHDNWCRLARFSDWGNANTHKLAIKQNRTGWVFPEHHSYIRNSNLGPPPNRSDGKYNSPINVGGVVCQDCRTQYQGDLEVTDSQQVNISSLQNCIGRLEQEAQQAEIDAENQQQQNGNAPNGNGSSPNGSSSNNDMMLLLKKLEEKDAAEQARREAEEKNRQSTLNTTLGIGGGIGLSVSCALFIVIGVLIFMLTKKRK